MELLASEFLGNAVQSWALALGITILTYAVLKLVVLRAARRLLRATATDAHYWDDVLSAALEATRGALVFVLSLSAGAVALTLPGRVDSVVQSLAVIALLVQGGLWTSAGLSEWLRRRARKRADEDPAEVMTVNVIGIAAKLGLWSLVLLLALDNLGVDVTALVAGLGVGGVAVALAAQNILGDLFASLSIVLDKPFVLGDFVIVGDYLGSVEAIGLKTTRVRSLSGEQVVFSNADMLSSRIRNYGRMYERRVVLQIGVTYQTPRRHLQEIPTIIREAIEGTHADSIRFDRAHMAQYGDFAITFEAVYYVLDADYNRHMDIKQKILLDIHEAFEERAVEFAYPTQTLYLANAPEMASERASFDVSGR